MSDSNSFQYPAAPTMSPEELEALTMKTVGQLMKYYEPGKDRVITPDNVFQEAQLNGQAELEAFQNALFLEGSEVSGIENLDHAVAQLAAGRTVLLMADHRGNMDVPSFNRLLRQYPRFNDFQQRLVYIAGRKLNESSDFIKMFSEKYSRLVIVPRRELPEAQPNETEAQKVEREANEQEASRINRAAFRMLGRLRKEGRVFVLFPLGGRWKADATNEPVKESTSYMGGFDTVYLVSMEGNALPVKDKMEDERPVQAKVVFRVGAPIAAKAFVAAQKTEWEGLPNDQRAPDAETHTVRKVMKLLDDVRSSGTYGEPVPQPE